MAAERQDPRTENLRDFLQDLRRDLQDPKTAFPFPAVKEHCRWLLGLLGPGFGADVDPEVADRIATNAGEKLLELGSQAVSAEITERLVALVVPPDLGMPRIAQQEPPLSGCIRGAPRGLSGSGRGWSRYSYAL